MCVFVCKQTNSMQQRSSDTRGVLWWGGVWCVMLCTQRASKHMTCHDIPAPLTCCYSPPFLLVLLLQYFYLAGEQRVWCRQGSCMSLQAVDVASPAHRWRQSQQLPAHTTITAADKLLLRLTHYIRLPSHFPCILLSLPPFLLHNNKQSVCLWLT